VMTTSLVPAKTPPPNQNLNSLKNYTSSRMSGERAKYIYQSSRRWSSHKL
jgi:hypothetical protein